MTMMTNPHVHELIAWLLEQIAEDERRAKAMAAEYPTPWDIADRGWMARVVADGPHFHEVIRVEQQQVSDSVAWLTDVIQHIETWNPDRVLAECDAKRKLIEHIVGQKHLVVDGDSWFTCAAATEEHDGGTTCREVGGNNNCDCGRDERVTAALRVFTSPYADRPGYREEWRP